MNLDDFSYEDNGRRYINPQVALDEENAFIQNLRDTQQQGNTQIAQQTQNLGTQVPSNLGGLGGSSSYFKARYQTPQTNYAVANLQAAAQAKALTDVLNNELNKAKKRYSDAYNAAVARSGGSGSGSNSNNNNGNTSGWDGEVDEEASDEDTYFDTGYSRVEPPKEEDYYTTPKQQNDNIREKSGIPWPDWLLNQLKIFG